MNEDFLKLLYENIGGSKVGTYEEFVLELKTDKEFQNLLYTNIGGERVGTFDEFLADLGFLQAPQETQQPQLKTTKTPQPQPQPQDGGFSTQIDWGSGTVNVNKPEVQKDYTDPSIDWSKGTVKPAVTVDGDFYQIPDNRQTARDAQDYLRNSQLSQELSTKRTKIERQPTAPTAAGYSWGTNKPVQGLYELSKSTYATGVTQDRSKETLEENTQKELIKAKDNFVKTVVANINQTPDSYINTQVYEDLEGTVAGRGNDDRAVQETRIEGAENALSHIQQAAEIIMGNLSARHPDFDEFLEKISTVTTQEQYQSLLKTHPNITQDPEYMQYEMLRQKYGEFKTFKDDVKDYLFQIDPETADLYKQKEFSKNIRDQRLYNLPLFDKNEKGIIPESVDVLMRNAGRFIGRLDVAAGGILNLVGATEVGGKLIRRGQDIQDLNIKDSRFDGFFEENFIKAGEYKIVFTDEDKKEIAYVRDSQGRQVTPLGSWEETMLQVGDDFIPVPDLIKDKEVKQEYNWKVFGSAAADTVMDLLPQIGGTAGFAKLAMSMGMGKAAAYTIGQGLSAATQVRGSSLQALQSVPDLTQDQRENIASVLASFTAVVSNINPLEKNMAMGVFSRTTADYIKKNAAKIASGQMTAADIARFGAVQVASAVGAGVKETLEETSESVFEKVVVNPIVNKNFKTKLEEGISSNEWKTTIGLSSTVGLLADVAGNFKLNFKNPLHRQAFIFATQDPEIFKSYVDGVKKGDPEFGTRLEEVFMPVIQELSTLDKEPTEKQVVEIAEYLHDARKLQDKINTTQNPIRKKELEVELEELYLKLTKKEKEVEQNADEEPKTEGVSMEERPQTSEEVRKGDTQGKETTSTGEAQKGIKAYDFDGTLFDNKTGKLTPLGEEVKQRIAEGEDITIITARDKENTKQIEDALSISPDKIEATGDEAKKGDVLKRRGLAPDQYFDADQAKLDAIRGGKLEEAPVEKITRKQAEEIFEYDPPEEIRDKANDTILKVLTSKKITPLAEPIITDFGDKVFVEYNNNTDNNSVTRLEFSKNKDGSLSTKGIKVNKSAPSIRDTKFFENKVNEKLKELESQKQAVEPTKKPQPRVESTKAEKVSPRAPQTVTEENTIEGFEPTNRKGEKIVGRVFTKEEDGTWKARVKGKNGKLSSGSNVNIPSVVEQLEKELEKRTTTSKPPAEVKAVEEKPSTKAAQETKKQISTKDVKLKKGEDFDNDRVYEVTYEGETIGRIYYDRSLHNSWLDADYTRTDAKDIFGDVLGTKEEALQAMVDRWNSKQEETPTEVKKEPTKVEEPAEAEEMFFEQKLPNKTIKRPVEVRDGKWYSTSQEATLEGDIEKQLDEKYPGVREGKVKPTETKTTEGTKDTPDTNEKAPKTILEKLGTSEKAVKAQIKKFFTDNIPGITPEQSQKLADANFIMWKAVANTLNPGKALQFMRRKVAQLGIISTEAQAQEMSTRIGGGLKFQIIGEKGAAALDAAEESSIRLDNLQVAREMESAGKDPKTIRLATGWERGKDTKWRYEIDDNLIDIEKLSEYYSRARQGNLVKNLEIFSSIEPEITNIKRIVVTNKGGKLSTNTTGATAEIAKTSDKAKDLKDGESVIVLVTRVESYVDKEYITYELDKNNMDAKKSHLQKIGEVRTFFGSKKEFKIQEVLGSTDLLKMYPSLGNIKIAFDDNPDYLGSYYPETKKIRLNFESLHTNQQVLSTMLHELQHAIQQQEGFSRGGNFYTANVVRSVVEQLFSQLIPYDLPYQLKGMLRDAFILNKTLKDHRLIATPLSILRDVKNGKFDGEKGENDLIERTNILIEAYNSRLNLDETLKNKHKIPNYELVENKNDAVSVLEKMPTDFTSFFKFVENIEDTNNKLRNDGSKAIISSVAKQLKTDEETIEQILFNYGDNPNFYGRLSGEVEARNVQSRIDLSPEQRQQTLLQETEDVARKDQIVFSESFKNLVESVKKGDVKLQSEGDNQTLPQVAEAIVNNAIEHLESLNKKGLELLRGTNDKESRKNIQQTIQENKKTIDHLKKMRKDPKFQVDSKFRGVAIRLANGQHIVAALESPIPTTFAHELFHTSIEDAFTPEEKQTLIDEYNEVFGDNITEWNTDASEYGARLYERFLSNGRKLTEAEVKDEKRRGILQQAFDTFTELMKELYNAVIEYTNTKGTTKTISLSPQAQAIFDRVTGITSQPTKTQANEGQIMQEGVVQDDQKTGRSGQENDQKGVLNTPVEQAAAGLIADPNSAPFIDDRLAAELLNFINRKQLGLPNLKTDCKK